MYIRLCISWSACHGVWGWVYTCETIITIKALNIPIIPNIPRGSSYALHYFFSGELLIFFLFYHHIKIVLCLVLKPIFFKKLTLENTSCTHSKNAQPLPRAGSSYYQHNQRGNREDLRPSIMTLIWMVSPERRSFYLL